MVEWYKKLEWDWLIFFLLSVPLMIIGGTYLIVTDSLVGYYVMIAGLAIGFLAIIGNPVLEKFKHKNH